MNNIIVFVLAMSAIGLAQDDKPPRFSIGLGVLAPSYSQKLPGNGRLDVDQDKNGFSYSLNNVPHASGGSSASYQSQSNPQQSQSQSASAPNTGNDYASPQGHFSIYSHRQIPKQSAQPTYNSASDEDDGQYRDQEQQSPASHQSGQYDPSSEQQYNPPPSAQTYSEPQNYNREPEYNSEPQQAQGVQGGQGGQQSQPHFGAYNFEQQIAHQFLNQQPLQLQPLQSYQSQPQPQQYQSYQSQPSQPQNYQLQSSQHQPIQLQSRPIQTLSQTLKPIQSFVRPEQPYNPHKQQIAFNPIPQQLYSLRV